MPRPLPPELVAPDHTALVVVECMNSVLGPDSTIPGLAESARREAVPNIARLIEAAHATRVPVLHCTVGFRADGLGSNRNAPLFQRTGHPTAGTPGAPADDPTAVIDELRPLDTDLVLRRMHGIGPMGG